MPKNKSKPGKGKKGKRKKKVGKGESRLDKESEVERAKANAALWEARLQATEFSRAEYREAARSLALNNEELTKHQDHLEKDMVDVIGFLKKQDMEKDELIEKLQQQLIKQKKSAQEEREKWMLSYGQQVTDLEEKCSQKANEMQVIQSELKMIKVFRKRKVQLEKELDEIKENLRRANQEHKEALSNMEHRFFEEKRRLEREAEKKIVMLAERAHTEAVMELDEAERSVFKENVRLKVAFSYHMGDADGIRKERDQLQIENAQLLQEKETNVLLVQEKVLQATQKKAQIKELQQSVRNLQSSLERMSLEFESELQRREQQSQVQNQAGAVELQKLQKLVEIREREMNRVKKLARNILEERTEVECFFLEALGQVKQEIMSSRNYYRQAAQAAYNSKMMQAAAGTDQYPKTRTFHNNEHSTNDVHQDLREAETWTRVQGRKVDIKDLTWEQKEGVLRLLFAKMNGFNVRKKSRGLVPSPLEAISVKAEEHSREPNEEPDISSTTFLTQHVPENPAASLVLPHIHTGKYQLMPCG
ncbi:basal body-orientation factor 1 [Ascaphus truei]|uniref:basal body-orientation factor 1 n=1 Tax=Ascaphus truei TaxID=8439 RepID=UPI003F5A72C8